MKKPFKNTEKKIKNKWFLQIQQFSKCLRLPETCAFLLPIRLLVIIINTISLHLPENLKNPKLYCSLLSIVHLIKVLNSAYENDKFTNTNSLFFFITVLN